MDVLFATPAFDSSVRLEFLESLIKTLDLCRVAGIKANFVAVGGDCYVARARNTLVRQFLDTDATHLFFLDADMGWDPEGVLKILYHDREVVGGAYPLKREQEDYPVSLICDADGRGIYDGTLMEAEWLPTGFLCIRRDVIQGLIALGLAAPYQGAGAFGMESAQMHNVFECAMDDGRWWGEDTFFCRKVRQLGLKIWLEPDIDFKHAGGKVYTGNYDTYLRKQPGGDLAEVTHV